MPISTISRTTRHFYFNYHHFESSSLCIHSSFIRRVQYAIRMVIAFLAGGFLAYGTPLNDQLAQQYLIPIMSTLCIQETFGMTFTGCYQMILAIAPLSVFLFVVQKIGLGYQDYVAAIFLLLISTLFVAYRCAQVQTRKIALLFNAIFFATIVNQPDLPSKFIFQLLEEFAIGMGVALIASLLVFPLFATFDIENRVNYSLANLQQMQTFLVQAFLCEDRIGAQISLTRAATMEQMIRKTISPIHKRLGEAGMEPSRCLQRIFNRRRRHLINLTLQEQEDLITSLFFHVCSLQLMVKQCQFNDYHSDFTRELQSSLLHLDSCQSLVIKSLMSSPAISKEEFTRHLSDLQQALESLRSAYIQARLHRVEYALESAMIIRSEDHLSHAFFLFQLGAIVRLIARATTKDLTESIFQEKKKKKKKSKKQILKEWFKPEWLKFLPAIKSTIIIGVGSVFVMVPALANAFENGQWILIALCMTQGETVGSAFTTMKMRLVGTLLGAMWAYVTYLAARNSVYQTFGMLVPWTLLFGYLRMLPDWGYTAVVAAFTPILINLGRIPYADTIEAGNYALLRIEENLVGIGVAIFLTLLIFPVFAIDELKDNIQTTLQACRQNVRSMHSIYDQLFHHEHSEDVSINLEEQKQEVKSFFDAQRCRFHQLISTQRTLVGQTSLEPTLWWFKNHFSTGRYVTLVQQQIDMFRMLHNIDAALMRINDCSINDEQQIENLQTNAAGGHFLPNLHTELSDLSRQLNDCLHLWSSYFALTQTRFYRFFRQWTYSRKKLVESDLLKHEQCLIELHQTVYRLQSQHQEALNRILDHYRDRLTEGETPSIFVPYASNDQADLIFIAISAMYYSTTQLVQAALALGTSIHTIFELETTRLYRSF